MFLTNFQAGPAGDPGHDFWFQPANTGTISGSLVNADTAMRLSTVYKCVKVISESLGMLPFHVYRSLGSRGRERVRDHPLARLLALRPNPWQTPMQFRMMLQAHASLRGTGYAEILWKAGEPDMAIPIHPDRVTPEMVDGVPRFRVRSAVPGGAERTLLLGEIFVLAGLSLDGVTGISPIHAEREAIGSAIAARDFGSRFWNNDARPPFWVSLRGKFKDNDARTNFRSEWQAAYGGSNRGKPAVLDDGMELHELGLNNTDAQWLETRKHSEIDVCGLWRVPPHKIGILDRATWGNVEQQNIDFVTDCLLPLAVTWEQTVTRDLVVDEDMFGELLFEQLMRGDTKTRYEAYGKAIQDGWMTRNEARALENRNPLPGLDEPLQPMNMQIPSASMGAPPTGGSPGRAAAILGASAQRVARKEFSQLKAVGQRGVDASSLHAAFEGHVRFVADVMAVPTAVAEQYCQAAVRRAEALGSEGLASLAPDAWMDFQVAALLRLEG